MSQSRPSGTAPRPTNPPPPTTTTTSSSSSSGQHNKPPPLSLEQSRLVARTHFDALRDWLIRENALANATTRTNAREKLTRLTRQQFQELSTDVYDELIRRLEDAAGRPGDQPFLPVRNEFHPKRNQARQKLATLPTQRFRDLASDVYFELDRRYPEFGDGEAPQETLADASPSHSQSLGNGGGGGYNSPVPSQSNNRHSRSESLSSLSQSQSQSQGNPPPPTGLAARRAPTPQSSNDVVVPNKSTLVMEDGPSPNNSSGGGVYRSTSATSAGGQESIGGGGGNRERRDSFSSQPGFAGLTKGPSSFSHGRSGSQSQSQSYGGGGGPLSPSDRHSGYDRERDVSGGSGSGNGGGGVGSSPGMPPLGAGRNTSFSRASETSSVGTRFIGGYAQSAASETGGGERNWEAEEREKLKADYEYKITMLQKRVAELERENEDASNALKNRLSEQDRLRDLEQQVRTHRERYEAQNSSFQQLREDYDALQTTRSRDISSSSDASRLRGEVDRLNRERVEAEELTNELRDEVGSLADELRSVNERYEVLLEGQQAGGKGEEEARVWKKRYEQAKVELRNMKATSQLFTSSFKVEGDYMPASPDGLIADVHVAAFQTSIDDLLQAARSKEPSSILGVARTVVTNVEKINGDVQAVDQRQLSTFSHDDQDQLESLKANVNATLSNLMTASKNHATSFGVSPVSLVDAAASHLANTVVDLVRLLKIRRTTAGGGGGGGGRIAHDPMPPLAESPASPPPPMPPSKPNGYLSGGIGSVKSALGAIGLGGQARDRDSKEVASVASPTPSYQQQQQQQQNATSNVRSPAAQSEYSVRGGYGGASSVQSPEGHSWEQDSRQGPAHAMHSSSNSREEESYRRAASPQQQRGYGAGGDASSISSFGRGQTSLRNGNGNGAEEREREVRRYDSSSPVMQQREQQQQQQTSALGNYSSSDGGGSYGYGQQPEGPYQGQYGANGGYSQDDDEQEERRDDGLENNAEELKAYIENQTEAIVHSIQSLLSAIRSGAQGEQLNENLTQIITIVSSIVAISRDALPSSARDEGDDILRDLTENCDKLSEMQAQSGGGATTFTKQTKQAMAGASFGLAKSLRELNRMLE